MTPMGFYDMNNQPHTGAYNGWGTALGNLHYQYRPIPEWKLTSEALSKLQVLIIPHAEVLDSADVTGIIEPWVKAGGRLIVTGNSGNRKGEAGNFEPYSSGLSLASLTGVSNVASAPATQQRTVGDGTVYYIKDNIGLRYFNASTTAARSSIIGSFNSAMSQVLGTEETLLSAIDPIPDSVGLNVYDDPTAKRFFVDVNNYDLNLTTDVVTPTPQITFTVQAPAWMPESPADDHPCSGADPAGRGRWRPPDGLGKQGGQWPHPGATGADYALRQHRPDPSAQGCGESNLAEVIRIHFFPGMVHFTVVFKTETIHHACK